MKDGMQQKLKEEPCNKAMCTSKANEQLVILTLYKTGSWMYRPNCAYRKFSTVLEMVSYNRKGVVSMPICPNNVRIDLANAGHYIASQAVIMCMACLEHARSPFLLAQNLSSRQVAQLITCDQSQMTPNCVIGG